MSDDHPHVLIFPPLLFAICLALGGLATWWCPYRLQGIGWVVGGALLAIAAVALARWGERVMKTAGTNVRPDQPSTAIVESGPFAYTRNPLYVGVILMFTGIGVALRSPAFLVFLVPLVLVLRYGVIAREERYLERKFGDVFRTYRGKVRRWL